MRLSKNVRTIGEGAFARCKALRTINLPNSLTSIENEGFIGCESLYFIEIPESVTTLGKQVFANCKRLNISFKQPNPNKIPGFGEEVFKNSKDNIVVLQIIVPRGSVNAYKARITNGNLKNKVIGF